MREYEIIRRLVHEVHSFTWQHFSESVSVSELAYRVNFAWQLFQSFLSLGVSLAGLGVVFSYTQTLGGWRPDQILALVGVYFLVGGLIGLFVQPAMEQFIESVRDGTFDFTLTKPEDAQLTHQYSANRDLEVD